MKRFIKIQAILHRMHFIINLLVEVNILVNSYICINNSFRFNNNFRPLLLMLPLFLLKRENLLCYLLLIQAEFITLKCVQTAEKRNLVR